MKGAVMGDGRGGGGVFITRFSRLCATDLNNDRDSLPQGIINSNAEVLLDYAR